MEIFAIREKGTPTAQPGSWAFVTDEGVLVVELDEAGHRRARSTTYDSMEMLRYYLGDQVELQAHDAETLSNVPHGVITAAAKVAKTVALTARKVANGCGQPLSLGGVHNSVTGSNPGATIVQSGNRGRVDFGLGNVCG